MSIDDLSDILEIDGKIREKDKKVNVLILLRTIPEKIVLVIDIRYHL